MKDIVVLISGNGSNLQAIADAYEQKRINGTIRVVFSSKVDAFGPKRAREANTPAHSLEATQFANCEAFDRRLIQKIDAYVPDIVAPAGYIRILNPAFVAHYTERLLNIHPSLLSKYPGLHTHRQVLESGDEGHSTSAHLVTDELDGGSAVLRAKVPVSESGSEGDVTARIRAQKHTIYSLVVSWSTDSRLKMRDSAVQLNGVRLPPQGYATDEQQNSVCKPDLTIRSTGIIAFSG